VRLYTGVIHWYVRRCVVLHYLLCSVVCVLANSLDRNHRTISLQNDKNDRKLAGSQGQG
jgi:hypothetical protein